MKKEINFFRTILLVTSLIALPAAAEILTYTSAAEFEKAAGQTALETFSGTRTGVSLENYYKRFKHFRLSSEANGDYSGIAKTNINPRDLDDNAPVSLYSKDQKFYGWGHYTGNEAPTTHFKFTPNVTAFGFDWFNTDITDSYSVFVNNQLLATYRIGSGFFGFIATEGEVFTTATVRTDQYGGYISTAGLDNIRVTGTDLPEPTSLALLGVGIISLLTLRKKNLRA